MKKSILFSICLSFVCLTSFAQYGTTTTYQNPYGTTTGTKTTTTDYLGNKNSTYKNPYGTTTGTKKTSTDYLGNKNSTYKNPYGTTTGTSK